jgi:hypothetical protein
VPPPLMGHSTAAHAALPLLACSWLLANLLSPEGAPARTQLLGHTPAIAHMVALLQAATTPGGCGASPVFRVWDGLKPGGQKNCKTTC